MSKGKYTADTRETESTEEELDEYDRRNNCSTAREYKGFA
jgi:hypothetical protein